MRVSHPPPSWQERLMRQTTRPRPPQAIPFLQTLTSFLTPTVWRQAHHAWQSPHAACRWELRPLLLTLLLMTWVSGDSQGERFETARAFYVACHQRHKRPGKTLQGFEKALARLPT